MNTSKLTREENVQAVFDLKAGYTLGLADVEILKRVARMALAAMDGEPVTWGNGCDKTVPAALRFLAENERPFGGESRFNTAHLYQLAREIELMAEAPLYRHAQPAPERDQVRIAHAEWSQATFGNVGPVGPLKHLSKEALEAAAEPGDLSEWADMQFLLWDAQRRAGITDEQIAQAMIEKLAVNKQRKWPEPKDGEPRLHIKEQPAPVAPEEITIETATIIAYGLPTTNIGAIFKAGHDACRAARLKAQSDDDGEPTDDERIMAIEGIHNCERCSDEGWVVGEMGITRCACNQGNSIFKIDLNSDFIKHVKAVSEKVRAGNSPVIPDVSASMLRRWLAFGRGMQNAGSQLPLNLISETESMLAAAPQPQNAPQNIPEIIPEWIPVSERMPTKQDGSVFLTWNGQYIGKELFLMGYFQCLKPEIITHWMPLPAAPQEVSKDVHSADHDNDNSASKRHQAS